MVEGSGEIREMAARIRAHDWESTSLGAIATWPQSLRTAVDILLAMPGPAAILWGPASVQLYNDAYVTIAKDRHPALLGRPVAEGWPEAYETLIAPLLYAARAGHATRLSDVSVMLHGADGRTTERVFDTDWSPIRDETGEVAGALQTLIEITERKRAEANGTLLAEIANDLSRLSAPDEIINAVGVRLAEALNLNLCLFVDVDEERDEVTVHHSWERDGLPSLKQTFRIGDFLTEEFARSQRAGETFVVRDTVTDERTDAEAYTPLSVASILAVPFHRRGRWVAYLAVTDASSRDWRVDEIEVVQEVAERVFGRIERARAEAALRESEERFRALATAGAFLIYRMSPDWTQMRQMLGRDFLADTSAPSETWADGYLLPEDRPEIFAAIEEAIRTKSLFELEHRVRQANGDVGWVLSRAVPIFSADGKIAEWFGAASDITDRKRSETALRESNERLNALFDVTPAGIAIADASGKILRFNKALMRIWGTPPIPESSLDYGAWKGRFADSGEPLRAEDWAMARALSTGEVVLGDVVDIERFDGSRPSSMPPPRSATRQDISPAELSRRSTSPSSGEPRPLCAKARSGRPFCSSLVTRCGYWPIRSRSWLRRAKRSGAVSTLGAAAMERSTRAASF